MNKEEYMSELKKKLENFGNELQQEILEDYARHFAEGEAAGRTDEELIEELGNIEDMIQDLGEAKAPMPDQGEAAAHTDGSAEQSGGQTALAAVEVVPEAGTGAVNGEFSRICLKTDSADILLGQSEDDSIYVEYCGDNAGNREKFDFYQYGRGDTFYAGIERKKVGSHRSFSFGATVVTVGNHFVMGNGELKLAVRIPKRVTEVKFATASGDVAVNKLISESLRGVTASGNVMLDGAVLRELKLNTASGDIVVREAVIESLRGVTASGNVMLDGAVLRELKLSTASGDIVVREAVIERQRFETASGDVRLEKGKCCEVELSTASGDVECEAVMAESINVQTASGDVRLRLGSMRDVSVEAVSRTGDIVLHCDGGRMKLKSGSRQTFGDGSRKVRVQTGSGDISIRQ